MAEKDKKKKSSKTEYRGTKTHMKRGMAFFKKADYQRAIKEFDLIILHDKDYVRAYNNLGYIYKTIGEYENALKVWEQGLKVDPSYRRLAMNIESLRRFLESQERQSRPRTIGIENFLSDIEWLSESSELIEIFEEGFFDSFLIEDDESYYTLITPRRPLSTTGEGLRAFETACSSWLELGASDYVVQANSMERIAGRPFLAIESTPDSSLRDYIEEIHAVATVDEDMTTGDSGAPGGVSDSFSGTLMQIIGYAIQLCLGLIFIHNDLEMPHGDVRPDNSLLYRKPSGGKKREFYGVGEEYFLRIAGPGLWAVFANSEAFCDFEGNLFPGFASEGLTKAPSGFLSQSISYCAPELIESSTTPTIASDVYSFGVTLYEMLTGVAPILSAIPTEMLKEIQSGRIDHPSLKNHRIPHNIGDMVLQCLEAKPEKRPKDLTGPASVLLDYLEAVTAALTAFHDLCEEKEDELESDFLTDNSADSMEILDANRSSLDIERIWNALKSQTESQADQQVHRGIDWVEETLLAPGVFVKDIFPTRSAIKATLTAIGADNFRHEFEALAKKEEVILSEESIFEDDIEESFSPISPAPLSGSSNVDVELDRVIEYLEDPGVQTKMSAEEATAPLIDKFGLLAEEAFLKSTNSKNLLDGIEKAAASASFLPQLAAILEDFYSISSRDDPAGFIEQKVEQAPETIPAISGFLFMLDGQFAPALESFNLIPSERYLPALNIFIWAMAKFNTEQMQEIRMNSLVSARDLLREAISLEGSQRKRSTVIVASPPKATLGESFLLSALTLEYMGEYKDAVSHFRDFRKILRIVPELRRGSAVWADLVQGKCMYELGLPSEGLIRWRRMLTKELSAPFFEFLEMGLHGPGFLLSEYMLRCCERALARYSDNAMLWCMKGKLQNYLGRYDESLDSCTTAIEIEDSFHPVHFVRMESLMETGRYEDALEAVRLCSAREPTDPLFMLREAEALCKLGRDGEAFRTLKRASDCGLDPTSLGSSIRQKRIVTIKGFEESEDSEN